MLSIYRFLVGFVSVRFSGDFSQKILNVCAQNRISVWNCKCIKQCIVCNMTVRDFKALPDKVRGLGIRAHILKKTGLPFYLARYRGRAGLLAGGLLFFCFLRVMSAFVWSVEVSGNEVVPESEILKACEAIGIHEGILKTKIRPGDDKQRLLLQMDSLAWASLNLEGCRLTVHVNEIMRETADTASPANLKAAADGVIQKIDVSAGNCLVKVGDRVKQGEVLVSGIIERQNSTQFVRSQGTVMAQTEKTVTVIEPFRLETETETGRQKTKCVLSFFGVRVPLYLGSERGSSRTVQSEKDMSLFGKSLPIRVYEKTFRQTEKRTEIRTETKLLAELEKKAEELLKAQGTENWSVTEKQITPTEDGLSLTLTVSAEENIAVPETILLSQSGEQENAAQ